MMTIQEQLAAWGPLPRASGSLRLLALGCGEMMKMSAKGKGGKKGPLSKSTARMCWLHFAALVEKHEKSRNFFLRNGQDEPPWLATSLDAAKMGLREVEAYMRWMGWLKG